MVRNFLSIFIHSPYWLGWRERRERRERNAKPGLKSLSHFEGKKQFRLSWDKFVFIQRVYCAKGTCAQTTVYYCFCSLLCTVVVVVVVCVCMHTHHIVWTTTFVLEYFLVTLCLIALQPSLLCFQEREERPREFVASRRSEGERECVCLRVWREVPSILRRSFFSRKNAWKRRAQEGNDSNLHNVGYVHYDYFERFFIVS